MKKRLFVAMMMLVSVGVAGVTPLLFEAYQEGTITIPEGESDTLTVAELSFSVDSACYVQLSTGGMAGRVKVWLELDGNTLFPVITPTDPDATYPIPITYICIVGEGEHIISLRLSNYLNILDPTVCKDAYLQALIFLPDTGSAIAEQPTSDAEPLPNTPSLISQGPYVNVAGATELVDASGRVIENAIEEDKVFISNLSTGTYFARDGDRTIVKIVKVD